MKTRFKYYSILLVAALLVGCYSYFIENSWIEVTQHEIKAPVKSSLTIAHLTDLHIRSIGRREEKLLSYVAEANPDIVVISGDSITEKGNYQLTGRFLKKLKAPLGVWIVRGNWEHWVPSRDEVKIYKESGVNFLNNENAKIRDDIWLIGVDDSTAGSPNQTKASADLPSNIYRIGVFHSPEYFEAHKKYFDLVLAGHTHGGQVRLPWLPALWVPPGSGKYVEGWYDSMYVSRGIGNSILDIRLFCRPELPIIKLVPQL